MKRSGSINKLHGQLKQKYQNKTKKAKRQTTRKSHQICVSPREATAKTQQKKGRGPTQTKTHKNCHTTQREFPTV
jgi:hypothetical protein